jgi:polyvinyl alcohol dehydrogenase (cytochrome)
MKAGIQLAKPGPVLALVLSLVVFGGTPGAVATQHQPAIAVQYGESRGTLVDDVQSPAIAASPGWSAYLHDPGHSSFAPGQTTITPANAGNLAAVWHWTVAAGAGKPLYSSPTVSGGRIYIGTRSGAFFALNELTGGVIWHRSLGAIPKLTCSGGAGFASTATVAPDPATGSPTVYTYGATGYLYALNAQTGATRWATRVYTPSSTVNDYYAWSSPTVYGKSVYVGISSHCDNPLVRGGVAGFDRATGKPLPGSPYYAIPQGSRGNSVWSSPAAAAGPSGGQVFATTGNGPTGDSEAIVRLNAATLARQDGWSVPTLERTPDGDFGGSPTLFAATINGTATPMVGACNKNGTYYALRSQNLSAGPVWKRKVAMASAAGPQCDAAAVWNGTALFVASGASTTIGAVTYPGAIRRVNPATGQYLWQRGLPLGPVIGSPSLNGGRVLAAATYNTVTNSNNGVYLINAATGAIVRVIQTHDREFPQPVFADGYLFIATEHNGLFAYHLPA